MKKLHWATWLAALIGIASLGSECDAPQTKTTGDPALGTNPFWNPTYEYGQSETAISTNIVGSSTVVTVTYNDETQNYYPFGGTGWQPPKIEYTESTRTVYDGASLMGFSYSLDKGTTWKYGGRLSPPSGWAVLWGDPSITNLPSNQNYVFMTSLAVPSSKYPAGGILNDGMKSALGGACIARSLDAGRTFSIYQCVSNSGHFYDGASMAAGPHGVYAAFKDVTSGRIDVWRASTANSTFYKLADPFPNSSIADGAHPRLRYAGDYLYTAAQRGDGVVMINRLSCGLFCAWSSQIYAGSNSSVSPTIILQSQLIRTGPQISFDVGTGLNDKSIRTLFTTRDLQTGRLHVRGSICPSTWVGCYDVPAWSTLTELPSGHQFNPLVRASTRSNGSSYFMTSFNSVNDGAATGDNIRSVQVELTGVFGGNLGYGGHSVLGPHPVCPDDRGYWGDYDDLQFLDINAATGDPRFIRAFSDSTNGCTYQWQYNSKHLHVSTAIIE